MNRFLIFIFCLLVCSPAFALITEDEVAKELPRNIKPPITYTKYNFESTERVLIRLKPECKTITENDLYEGQEVKFRLTKDVIYNRNVIAKSGSEVKAKVGVIITPGMNGIPASVIFKDFEIPGLKNSRLTDCYEIFGQDRSLLVFPLKWALTPLPPTGSLTNFIKGGHVKLNSSKTLRIYYYPNWI